MHESLPDGVGWPEMHLDARLTDVPGHCLCDGAHIREGNTASRRKDGSRGVATRARSALLGSSIPGTLSVPRDRKYSSQVVQFLQFRFLAGAYGLTSVVQGVYDAKLRGRLLENWRFRSM